DCEKTCVGERPQLIRGGPTAIFLVSIHFFPRFVRRASAHRDNQLVSRAQQFVLEDACARLAKPEEATPEIPFRSRWEWTLAWGLEPGALGGSLRGALANVNVRRRI